MDSVSKYNHPGHSSNPILRTRTRNILHTVYSWSEYITNIRPELELYKCNSIWTGFIYKFKLNGPFLVSVSIINVRPRNLTYLFNRMHGISEFIYNRTIWLNQSYIIQIHLINSQNFTSDQRDVVCFDVNYIKQVKCEV